MNKTLREISFLLAAGMILAGTCTLAPAQEERTLVVPFGRNKELAPAHDVYKFPYKENYIMLPLTNGQMVTEDGGMRVIVNKPIQLNKRRTTVIPLGQGAPNISPTPIVPQGFNGGSVPLPVNRPEGVVVRRIYPQQEFITSSESSPEMRTYEEPQVSERTEALPSVVSPEDSTPAGAQEHSIVSPAQPAPSETTLSTSVDGTQTAPSPYETSTPSDYGSSSGGSTPSDYGTSSGGSTPSDYGSSSGGSSPSDYGSSSGGSTPSDYGSSSGGSSPSDYGSSSGGSTPSDYGSSSGGSSPSDYGSSSGGSSPSDYGTPSGDSKPSDYGTPSGDSKPSDYGTPSDPYRSDYSYETPQESETPTSAWRSTTSNPAVTYDSGMVGESPMVMTRQESNQNANPWETQSARPQVEESVSPVVTVPGDRTGAIPQTVQQNSASSPASSGYVEVRPRSHSARRGQQNRNSGASPAQGPSAYSPKPQTVPQYQPQYQPPREIPAQLPPPDPNQQTPKPSGDGRKV